MRAWVDPIPTVTEVDQIAAIADPVIRNLLITQSYHELAVAVGASLGANWCTFATWASKQAGQTIRKEDFARTLEAAISSAPFSAQATTDLVVSAQAFGSNRSPEEIRESVADVINPLAALDRASDAVARGNKKVYEEIGREFARFLALRQDEQAITDEQIVRFCADLRPGEPPDGQRYLREAFAYYAQAFAETDAKRRAERMLLANIAIGIHEQMRLQPEIAEAMDAAFLDPHEFRARLIGAIFPYGGWLARARLFVLRLLNHPNPLDAALDALLNEARRRTRLVITEYVMSIDLPHGVRLRLGQDLGKAFPDSLKQITLAELSALLATVDPTPDSTTGTGAVDWSRLPDRLHFIADLFRCYHESAELFDAPFMPEQVTALKAGRLPEGIS